MKPPICHLCNRPLASVGGGASNDGRLVRFADFTPLTDGVIGHPRGLEWFCAEHVALAEQYSAQPIELAMLEMRNQPQRAAGSGAVGRLLEALRDLGRSLMKSSR